MGCALAFIDLSFSCRVFGGWGSLGLVRKACGGTFGRSENKLTEKFVSLPPHRTVRHHGGFHDGPGRNDRVLSAYICAYEYRKATVRFLAAL